MDTELAPPTVARAGASSRRTPWASAALLVGTCLLVGAWASFMVPLLRAGLADAPMVTLRDSSALFGDFEGATGLASLPEPLATAVFLLWFATIALGPLAAAAGVVAGGWVAVRSIAGRRPAGAAAALLTVAGCAAVLAVALSPWGRTAKAWFFD